MIIMMMIKILTMVIMTGMMVKVTILSEEMCRCTTQRPPVQDLTAGSRVPEVAVTIVSVEMCSRITQRPPVQDLTAGSRVPEVWGSLVYTCKNCSHIRGVGLYSS